MKIIHISDLHFGAAQPGLQEALTMNIREATPDLIIASGDFTQTGRSAEFIQARDFLNGLGAPVFSVCGNHDITRFNLLERLFHPYKRYRHYITRDLEPVYHGDGVIVAGINTARRILPHWNWANGAVSKAQRESLKARVFRPEPHFKICVMHHPVHRVKAHPFKTLVFGGRKALSALKEARVDLVLTGHVHHASVTTMDHGSHRTIFLSASTALSTRLRGSDNGYNIITVMGEALRIEVIAWADGRFRCMETFEHER